MLKLTLSDLAEMIEVSYPIKKPFQKISVNSKNIDRDTLFFALPGSRTDGHLFLEEVAKKGAAGAVVSKSYIGSNFGMPLLFVDDTLKVLQDFAKKILRSRNPKVIGITGSLGKTTTKEFVYTLLKGTFHVGKTPDNFNTQIGLPLTILNAEGDEEILILEMGMTEKGQIENLVRIAPPHVAVLTKIAHQHAAFFEDLEDIAQAKAEIFTSKHLVKVFSHKSNQQFNCIQNARILPEFFSFEDIKDFTFPFEALHLKENALAAIAVAQFLGIPVDTIKKRLKELKPFKRRFECLTISDAFVINDSYNASPESVEHALKNLPRPKRGKKTLAVLGELKELGKHTDYYYNHLAHHAAKVIDYLLCFGSQKTPFYDIFLDKGKPVEFFSDKIQLKKRFFELLEPGDVALVKGANSNQLWEIVED